MLIPIRNRKITRRANEKGDIIFVTSLDSFDTSILFGKALMSLIIQVLWLSIVISIVLYCKYSSKTTSPYNISIY